MNMDNRRGPPVAPSKLDALAGIAARTDLSNVVQPPLTTNTVVPPLPTQQRITSSPLLMQRKRRLSESDACAVEPPRKRISLTIANLIRLQQSITSNQAESMADSQPPTPSWSKTSNSTTTGSLFFKSDPVVKYQNFGIFFDEGATIPLELEAYVTQLKSARASVSPNAKNIAIKSRMARQSEQGGIDLLLDHLLLLPATTDGKSGMERAPKENLNRQFLPQSRYTGGRDHLERPQPDHAFGYLPSKQARRAKLSSPFTMLEEKTLNYFPISENLYFPFFTAHWKSVAKQQTHDQAIPQGARDGAAIINHLYQFYETARSTRPSLVETCHISATIDMRTCMLWIHWREENKATKEISYHMECIESCFLHKVDDNEKFRTILRNLQDYAMGERLGKIKELIPEFDARYIGITPPEEEINANPETVNPPEVNANPEIMIVNPPSPITGDRRALPISPASLLTSPGHHSSPPPKRSKLNLQNLSG